MEDVSQEKVRLNARTGEEITLALEQAVQDRRLSHAMTYHASQGSTLEGRMRLFDVDHPRYTLRHLYVGLSRSTSAALVDVV